MLVLAGEDAAFDPESLWVHVVLQHFQQVSWISAGSVASLMSVTHPSISLFAAHLILFIICVCLWG